MVIRMVIRMDGKEEVNGDDRWSPETCRIRTPSRSIVSYIPELVCLEGQSSELA